MSHAIFEYSLERLDEMEGAEITLPCFDSSIAWQIGVYAHTLAQKFSKPILIDITLSNGQILFHSPSKNGAVLDNEFWVSRKKKTTLRFAKSSFYIGRKVAIKQMSVESALFVDPIKVSGCDAICGALTVSGLAQEEDHLFALQVLSDMKAQLTA